jgi:hypothetical protein
VGEARRRQADRVVERRARLPVRLERRQGARDFLARRVEARERERLVPESDQPGRARALLRGEELLGARVAWCNGSPRIEYELSTARTIASSAPS